MILFILLFIPIRSLEGKFFKGSTYSWSLLSLQCFEQQSRTQEIFVEWDGTFDVDVYAIVRTYEYLVFNKIKDANPDFEKGIIAKLPQIKNENTDRLFFLGL